MMIYEPVVIADQTAAANATRPAVAIVHDAPAARALVFRIEPQQQVAPHTSRSTVLLSIVAGSGLVSGEDGERAVRAGDLIAYAPNERHGMRALDERLVVLAVIAPRPETTQ